MTSIGLIKGDTRSLDNGSHGTSFNIRGQSASKGLGDQIG